uniref:rhomboid protease n=1 Tax=Salmo trutta TaxID=8032 RepID=A0A674C3C6_SALTR
MAWRGCVLRWTRADIISTATRGNRFTLNTQQRCSFRKAAKETNTKKGVIESFSRLVKPLVFTIGFTACSFGTAAIWQYESLKSRVQSYFDEERANWLEKLRPQKQGDLRKRINQWWNSLSEGQRTVTGIIAANAVVFCCWRVPSLQRSMIKYFTSNPASKTLCVISTMFSYVCKTASGRLSPSLGASGASLAIVAMDTAGLVLGWRYFDHAAHLGGAIFGIWYIMYGHELIWKNREPLVKVWHDLRTKGPGGGGNGGSGPL